MPHEKLENLVRTGDLKSEPPDVDEVDGLIQSGLIRLEDSRNPDLGYESKFDLAYNAAHAFSLAAVRIAGDRLSVSDRDLLPHVPGLFCLINKRHREIGT